MSNMGVAWPCNGLSPFHAPRAPILRAIRPFLTRLLSLFSQTLLEPYSRRGFPPFNWSAKVLDMPHAIHHRDHNAVDFDGSHRAHEVGEGGTLKIHPTCY